MRRGAWADIPHQAIGANSGTRRHGQAVGPWRHQHAGAAPQQPLPRAKNAGSTLPQCV